MQTEKTWFINNKSDIVTDEWLSYALQYEIYQITSRIEETPTDALFILYRYYDKKKQDTADSRLKNRYTRIMNQYRSKLESRGYNEKCKQFIYDGLIFTICDKSSVAKNNPSGYRKWNIKMDNGYIGYARKSMKQPFDGGETIDTSSLIAVAK